MLGQPGNRRLLKHTAGIQAIAGSVERLTGDLDDEAKQRLQGAIANLSNKVNVSLHTVVIESRTTMVLALVQEKKLIVCT